MNTQTTLYFYVYRYLDPRPAKNRAVIYVGKGTTDSKSNLKRMRSHWTKTDHDNLLFDRVLKKIRTLGLKPVCEVVSWHLIEEDAFAAEIHNIGLHGLRRDGGTLCNLTYGGEGAVGMIHTTEALDKIRIATRQHWQNPDYVIRRQISLQLYRDTHPDELLARIEKSKLAWTPDKREVQSDGVKSRGPEFAQKISESMTPERRARASENASIALQTPEVIAKRKVTLKSTMSTAEFRAELSKRTKAALATPEAKANKSAAMGKLWQDPIHREKMMALRAGGTSDEVKQKLSTAAKKSIANQSDETKQKLSDFRRAMATERHAKNKSLKIESLDLGELRNLYS